MYKKTTMTFLNISSYVIHRRKSYIQVLITWGWINDDLIDLIIVNLLLSVYNNVFHILLYLSRWVSGQNTLLSSGETSPALPGGSVSTTLLSVLLTGYQHHLATISRTAPGPDTLIVFIHTEIRHRNPQTLEVLRNKRCLPVADECILDHWMLTWCPKTHLWFILPKPDIPCMLIEETWSFVVDLRRWILLDQDGGLKWTWLTFHHFIRRPYNYIT